MNEQFIDTETPVWMAQVDPARRRQMIAPENGLNTPEAILRNRQLYNDWCAEKHRVAAAAHLALSEPPSEVALAEPCEPVNGDEPQRPADPHETCKEPTAVLAKPAETRLEQPGEKSREPLAKRQAASASVATPANSERQQPSATGDPEEIAPAPSADVKPSPSTTPAHTTKRRSSKRVTAASDFVSPVDFKAGDRVRTLPGEKPRKHEKFVERAREYLDPGPLSAQFLFSDAMRAHHEARFYADVKDRYLYDTLKDLYFGAIYREDPKAAERRRTDFWKNGQPTEKGLAILARAGIFLDQLKAQAVVDNLQTIGTLDHLGASHRAVRYDTTRKLEREKAERQGESRVVALPFRAVGEDS